jgi:hypothetical protein
MTVEDRRRICLCLWDEAIILVHRLGIATSLHVNIPHYDFHLLLSKKRQSPITSVGRAKAIHLSAGIISSRDLY